MFKNSHEVRLNPTENNVTSDDMVILASEVGVLSSIDSAKIVKKGRLEPGRMFLVDMEAGRIVDDQELKSKIALEKPYRKWLDESLIEASDLPVFPNFECDDYSYILTIQKAFGYTF